jgi:hypothetical protein
VCVCFVTSLSFVNVEQKRYIQTRLNGFFVPSEVVCICGIEFLPTIEGLQAEASYSNVLLSSFLEHNLYELV